MSLIPITYYFILQQRRNASQRGSPTFNIIRTSIALGCYFLELNGYDYTVKKFVWQMENIAVWVADGLIGKDLLREIIRSLIYEDDYSESLKLQIMVAISSET